MKKSILITLAVLAASLAFGQGTLTPPGAPAPTMKTLDQVEPRIPISSAPITLSAPGSYYLTTNLSGTVTIVANNVTLDLMGFSVISASGNALSQSGSRTNLLIRNGVISAPTGNGVDFSTSTSGANGVLEDLRVTGCNFYGLAVADGYTVRRCHVDGVTLAGIRGYGDSRIIGNTVVNCGTGIQLSGMGAYVADNIVKGNADNYDFADGNQLNILLSEVPETIDWPCSAKLAGSLTSTGHGVVITTDGVTLDLMGFTLSGDGGSGDYGVFVDGATNRVVKDVVVRNGSVKNFEAGIWAEYSLDGCFEKLSIFDNTFYGVLLSGVYGQCKGNTIADCTINGNDNYGVYLSGAYGQCKGNTIADCTINGNDNYGVYLDGSSGQCNDNTIANCTSSGNSVDGIDLNGQSGQCNNNTVADCTLSGNDWSGIFLSGSSGQCDGNTFTDCTISGNGSDGVYLDGSSGQCDGNTIADCTIRKNWNYGISLIYADGNRVEGNHVTGQAGSNTYGIYCSGTTNNLIIRNSCVGQTHNFQFIPNDTYGPIVTSSGAMATTNGAAALSPWANFSR